MNAVPENHGKDDSDSHRRVRRLFCGRALRRWLFLLACLVTLIGLFYTEENVRGKRAWDRYRRESKAHGTGLDWADYIPPPVPDEQNIFKVPRMTDWFVKDSAAGTTSNELTAHLSAAYYAAKKGRGASGTNPVLLAEVKLTAAARQPENEKSDAVWRPGAVTARNQARKLVENAVGPSLSGSQNILLLARPTTQIKAARIVLQADELPTKESIMDLFQTNSDVPGALRFRVEPFGSNSIRVWLSSPGSVTAADYLAATDGVVDEFDLIREAVKRPYARMGGDYQQPFAMAIPNFVAVRSVAQTLAQRTQCYLLLGEPQKAWHELSLIHDLCRVLEAKPASPMTLVAAMINVAVTGLYASTVSDGLRLHAWQEPQLAAIEQQLKETNLLPYLFAALACERAAVCHTVEITRTTELTKVFFGATNLWQKLRNPESLLLAFVPRGWVYQNMAACAALEWKVIDGLNLADNRVLPHKSENASRELESLGRFSLYTFLARIAIPNLTKATQTLARNQTMANQALLACALERYRLTQGRYPETLGALVPEFVEHLPRDLIGGQPLIFRRTADGGFVLYSIGWNEKDDGGVASKTATEGDWVWESPGAGNG